VYAGSLLIPAVGMELRFLSRQSSRGMYRRRVRHFRPGPRRIRGSVASVSVEPNRWPIADATRLRCFAWPDLVHHRCYRETAFGRSFCLNGTFVDLAQVWGALMEKLLLVAALACQPGDPLIDLSGKPPRGLQSMDFIVSVQSFYTQVYIHHLGYPDSFQQCCSNKPTSVLRVQIGTGRFCVRQSQSQMKWSVQAVLRPGIEM
jgi:hypothetical protein